jgi:hypothetical protein
MLTQDDLQSLDEGDVVQMDSLLKGLSPKPLQLRVRNHNTEHKNVTFVATWFGVTLGVWIADYSKPQIDWKLT